MKILFNAEGVAQGTALDAYEGPDAWGMAPEDFDPALLKDYTLVGGEVVFVPSSRITKLSFRNRFTENEKVMIEMASLDNPSATMPDRLKSAKLRVYLADVNAARDFIDLQREDTRAGVLALETFGLLTAGRALVILDSPILPIERP